MSDYHDAGLHEGCRALWLGVLHAGAADAVYGVPKNMGGPESAWDPIAWVGSRDFAEVSDLAGVDPDYAEMHIRRWMAAGRMPHGRKAPRKAMVGA